MKTIELTIYRFSELSPEAQQVAINKIDYSHESESNYQEAIDSLDRFYELIGLKYHPLRNHILEWTFAEGSAWDSYFDIAEARQEMKGLRLRKYLINNYWDDIYKGMYRGSIGDDEVIKHPRIKTKFYDLTKGARVASSNFYYSAVFKESCCPLTGVCWDEDLLDPIREMIDKYEPAKHDEMTIYDLINECVNNLRKTLEDNEEYINSDEYKRERLEDEDQEIYQESGLEF